MPELSLQTSFTTFCSGCTHYSTSSALTLLDTIGRYWLSNEALAFERTPCVSLQSKLAKPTLVTQKFQCNVESFHLKFQF